MIWLHLALGFVPVRYAIAGEGEPYAVPGELRWDVAHGNRTGVGRIILLLLLELYPGATGVDRDLEVYDARARGPARPAAVLETVPVGVWVCAARG